jgi:hypothetical protein
MQELARVIRRALLIVGMLEEAREHHPLPEDSR